MVVEVVRFGTCTFDVASRRLRRGENDVRLQPLLVDLLLFLIANRHRTVTRDELIDQVWGGRIVSDAALYSRLSELRKAIGDDPKRRMIRTVYGGGVRFVGTVASTVASAEPTRLRSARPLVTVAAVRFAGETAPDDPEELVGWARPRIVAATAALQSAGGWIVRSQVDGIVAAFGWPDATERDAVRAGEVALQLAGASHITATVGLATGRVYVDASGPERTFAGEPISRAERLAMLAAPGTVLEDEATADVTRDACLREPRPELAASAKTAVHQLLATAPNRSRFEARAASSAPAMVGRERELARLRSLWEAAVVGMGGIVYVSGEAGIGKSRLVHELGEAIGGDVVRLLGQASPDGTASPLRPILHAFSRAAGVLPSDDAEAWATKLADWLRSFGVEATRTVRRLAELHGAPGVAAREGAKTFAGYNATLRDTVQLLESVSIATPLLLVVEDAHWLDPTTADLLTWLDTMTGRRRMLVVVTSRPSIGTAPPPRGAQTMRLDPLADELIRRLMDEIVAAPLDAAVCDEVVARAEGVPLFAEELTRVLATSLDGARRPSDPLAIPVSLEGVLCTRADAAGPARELAELASVIGREVACDVLAEASGSSEQALLPALDKLTETGLLRRASEGTVVFKHALLRDALYNTLAKSRRRAMHADVAAAIVRRRPAAAAMAPESLAQHFDAADAPEDALFYWCRAGARAADEYAHPEAAVHYRHALAAVDRLPPTKLRLAKELEVLEALITPVLISRGTPTREASELLTRLEQRARAAGDVRRESHALINLVQYLYLVGDLDEADRVLERLRTLANLERNDGIRSIVDLHASQIAYYRGDFAASQARGEAAARCPRATSPLPLPYVRPRLQGLGRAAAAACIRGEVGVALEQITHLEDRGRATASPSFEAWIERDIAWVAFLLGDVERARRPVARLKRLCRRYGLPVFAHTATLVRAWIHNEDGEPGRGADLLRASIPETMRRYAILYGCTLPLVRAECELRAERIGTAQASAHEGLEATRRFSARVFHAELLRLLGAIEVRRGAEPQAEAAFDRAIDVASAQGARLFELKAATALAQYRLDQGAHDQAAALLAPRTAAFALGPSFPHLDAARAVLASAMAAGDTVPIPPNAPSHERRARPRREVTKLSR